MHKIIAAFDGLNYSKSTSEYAMQLSKKINGFLTGVFLDDRTYTSYKIYQLIANNGISEKKLRTYKEVDEKKRFTASKEFDEECNLKGIPHIIHHDKQIALIELLHESIFADLLLINNQETFSHHSENAPSRFIRDLLSDVHCPVLLTPSDYKPIEQLFFLYDGQPQSMHALKMFYYIFQDFGNIPIEIISIKSMESNMHLPDGKFIKEWIGRHFKNATYTTLKGLPANEIVHHINKSKKHSIIILGAHRKTILSRWFTSSITDVIIKEFDMPLFMSQQIN